MKDGKSKREITHNTKNPQNNSKEGNRSKREMAGAKILRNWWTTIEKRSFHLHKKVNEFTTGNRKYTNQTLSNFEGKHITDPVEKTKTWLDYIQCLFEEQDNKEPIFIQKSKVPKNLKSEVLYATNQLKLNNILCLDDIYPEI